MLHHRWKNPGYGPRAARCSAIALFMLPIASLNAQPASPLQFTALDPVPAEAYRGSTGNFTFRVTNTTDAPIVIGAIQPRKGSGSGRAEPAEIAGGEAGLIRITYTFPEALGSDQVNFMVRTDHSDHPVAALPLPYFVHSAYSPDFPALRFKQVFPGQRLVTRLSISTRLVPALRHQAIVSTPEWIDAEVLPDPEGDPQTLLIEARIDASRLPVGRHSGEFVFRTNVDQDPELRLPVIADRFSRYSAEPSMISFGAMTREDVVKRTVRLERHEGGEVAIRSIDAGSPGMLVEQTDCGDACTELQVTLDSTEMPRNVRGKMTIIFEDDDVPLVIGYDAIVARPGVTIHDMGNFDDVTVFSETEVLEEVR